MKIEVKKKVPFDCQRCKYHWLYGGKLNKPICPSCGARVITGTNARKGFPTGAKV